MMINPRVLKMLKNTGFTHKEAGELANRFRKVFESLPTVKQLAERMYFKLR